MSYKRFNSRSGPRSKRYRTLARARWAVVAVALSFASPVLAEEIKIGFVDVPRLLDQAPQAEEARQRIQTEFAPLDQKLLRMQRELRDMETELLRDRDVLARAQQVELERDILARERELRRSQEEFREDLNLRRNQELQKLQRQVVLAIRAMAKAESYDLVISDGVLFAGTRVDMTEKVLVRLREEFDRETSR